MRRVVYSPSARDDFDRIAAFIAGGSGDTAIARSFVARIRQHCRRMAALGGKLGTLRPEIGDDIRSTPLGSYIIFFRYDARRMQVIRVVEGHRDLGQLRLPPA